MPEKATSSYQEYAPPETKEKVQKDARLLELMHTFINAIQAQDNTTTESPGAVEALTAFRQLVKGVL